MSRAGLVAEAGLLGLAEAEVDAVDGVDLGLVHARRHAGGGVVVGLGGAALFEGGLLGFGLARGLFGVGGVGGGLLVGAVEGALVAHALGIERLVGGQVLGLLDLAEEIVDGKIGFAGTCRFWGHGALARSA